MALPHSFYKKIETQVSELLKKLNVDHLPIPIDHIAQMVGTEIVHYDLGTEVSGLLVISDDRGTIGVNPSQSKARQRFTIAHELGHYLLHRKSVNKELFVDKDFIVKFRSKKVYTASERRHEIEANAFAASLLMPKAFILREMENEVLQDLSESELIEALAKLFEVSVMAMTYRLSDLNLSLMDGKGY